MAETCESLIINKAQELNRQTYKYCFVPNCRNTSITHPDKLFVAVPSNPIQRKKWMNAARREGSIKSHFSCCSDHFNLSEDLLNYFKFAHIGGICRLKKDVVPHIFHDQPSLDNQPNKQASKRSIKVPPVVDKYIVNAIKSKTLNMSTVVDPCGTAEIAEMLSSPNLEVLKMRQIEDNSLSDKLSASLKPIHLFLVNDNILWKNLLKKHLTSCLSKSGLFKNGCSYFSEWMIKAGLLKSEYVCDTCRIDCTLVVASSTAILEEKKWMCLKCGKLKSIRVSSFLQFHPIPLHISIALVYHWAMKHNYKLLFLNFASVISQKNPEPIFHNFWISLRRLCSAILKKYVKFNQMGGSDRSIIINTINLPRGLMVIFACELNSSNLRFKVITTAGRQIIAETLIKWIKPRSTIYTPKETIRNALLECDIQLGHKLNNTFSKYLSFHNNVSSNIEINFTRDFYIPTTKECADSSSSADPKKDYELNGYSRIVAVELMQLILDEVSWRCLFGKTESEAFINILNAIRSRPLIQVQNDVKSMERFIETIDNMFSTTDLKKNVSEKIKECDSSNNGLIPNATKTEIIPQAAPLPDPAILDPTSVSLEKYYYARYDPNIIRSCPFKEFMETCHVCSEVYFNNIELMEHLEQHIDYCDIQNQPIRKIDLFMMKANLTYCKICKLSFQDYYTLSCHMKTNHKKESKDTVDMYFCRICEIEYKDLNTLASHMLIYHKRNEMPYQCHECIFWSSLRQDVIDHFKQLHRSTDKLLCRYCLQIFPIKRKLDYFKHLLDHHNSNMYPLETKCDKCSLTFLRKIDWSLHFKKIHSALRPIIGYDESCLAKITFPKENFVLHPLLAVQNGKKQSTKKFVNDPKPGKNVVPPKNLSKYKCIECFQPFTKSHMGQLFSCSKCKFSTYCERIYYKQMKKTRKFYKRRKINLYLVCDCLYQTSNGNEMASHLLECESQFCVWEEVKRKEVERKEPRKKKSYGYYVSKLATGINIPAQLEIKMREEKSLLCYEPYLLGDTPDVLKAVGLVHQIKAKPTFSKRPSTQSTVIEVEDECKIVQVVNKKETFLSDVPDPIQFVSAIYDEPKYDDDKTKEIDHTMEDSDDDWDSSIQITDIQSLADRRYQLCFL